MQRTARSLGRVAAWAIVALASVCFAAEKPRLQVDDYIIHVAVTPQTHELKAQARVKFTALDDVNVAIFELHNALRPTRVVDASGQSLIGRARQPGLDHTRLVAEHARARAAPTR